MLSFSRQIRLRSHVRETNSDKSGIRIALANVIWLALHLTNALVCNVNASATLASKLLSAYPQRAFPLREKRSSISGFLIPAKGWTVVTGTMTSTMYMTNHGKMAILLLHTFIALARISIKTHTAMTWKN